MGRFPAGIGLLVAHRQGQASCHERERQEVGRYLEAKVHNLVESNRRESKGTSARKRVVRKLSAGGPESESNEGSQADQQDQPSRDARLGQDLKVVIVSVVVVSDRRRLSVAGKHMLKGSQ